MQLDHELYLRLQMILANPSEQTEIEMVVMVPWCNCSFVRMRKSWSDVDQKKQEDSGQCILYKRYVYLSLYS